MAELLASVPGVAGLPVEEEGEGEEEFPPVTPVFKDVASGSTSIIRVAADEKRMYIYVCLLS